jgi:preprotein translocase subunit SecA
LDFLDDYASTEIDLEHWDYENLRVNIQRVFGIEIPGQVPRPQTEKEETSTGDGEKVALAELSRPELEDYLIAAVLERYEEKEKEASAEFMRWFERMVMLQIMDQQWKDHLLALDHLKEGIGLRGYGQRDPKVEYKRESFALFEDLRDRVREEIVRMLFLLRPATQAEEREILSARAGRPQGDIRYSGGESESAFAQERRERPQVRQQARGGRPSAAVKTVVRATPKVGRNQPCPCGSGKKYKKCCGR